MGQAFNNQQMIPFTELFEINKTLQGLNSQKKGHEQSIKGISDLVRDLKANRHKKMQRIVGGTLIVDVDNQKAIADLMKQKTDIEAANKAISEQIMHREDNFDGVLIKIYKSVKPRIPKDILEEI